MAGEGPRVLLTGFSSFPGVSANPTEALIDALRSEPEALQGLGEVHLATLAVEYRALAARLEALGRAAHPDIALHFGVSRGATAFALETTARNRACTLRPDNAGRLPANAFLHEAGADLATTLPVRRIADALARHGLPADLSDDAGDYVCNALFYLSCGGHCPDFRPGWAGFVHVPPFGTTLAGEPRRPFDLATLVEGALHIADACVQAWREDSRKAAR